MASVRSSEDISRERELSTPITQTAPITVALSTPTWLVKNGIPGIPASLVKNDVPGMPTWLVTYNIPGIDTLPVVLQWICLAYANYSPSEEKEIYRYPSGTFFAQHLSQIQYRLEKAANDILNGYIDIATLTLVKANEKILDIQTQSRDRHGRGVRGTLIDIAIIADDMDLREKKSEEKEDHHSALGLLAQAGGLSKDEIAKRVNSVLFSDEAKKANETRKEYVLTLLREFAESIIKRTDLPSSWKTPDDFKEIQEKCKTEINKLRENLIPESKPGEVMTSGYIFPSSISFEAAKWFSENLARFGDEWSTKSDLFWVNGYGSLQWAASARDAQVWLTGISHVVDKGQLPIRSRLLQNPDGSSHFEASSKLGLDFYLGFKWDEKMWRGSWCEGLFCRIRNLEILKTEALQNLCKTQTIQPQRGSSA